MMGTPRTGNLAALRRFAAAPSPPAAVEHCELCSLALAPVHRHLLEMASRQVVCACDACALRFPPEAHAKFTLIPRDARALPGFEMTDAQWDDLALPIGLAFFVRQTPGGAVVARYPSPAGVTESLLPLSAWDALGEANPVLERMEPDVEALLVNRVGEARDYFLAPIDTCYELAGLVRLHWRGLSGGTEVWQEIGAFFDRLRAHARPLQEARHA